MKKCIRLVINKNLWRNARSTKYKKTVHPSSLKQHICYTSTIILFCASHTKLHATR